ncbi:hypothetical protein [Gandjariella thermophila]|nr:hypothetical protein [Gandjariella thermophila]
MGTVVGTVAVLVAAGTGTASAAPESSLFAVQTHMRLGITGPVGMIAILLGVGGLVFGLVRHRRAALARSAAEARQRAAEGVRQATAGGVGATAAEQLPTQV